MMFDCSSTVNGKNEVDEGNPANQINSVNLGANLEPILTRIWLPRAILGNS